MLILIWDTVSLLQRHCNDIQRLKQGLDLKFGKRLPWVVKTKSWPQYSAATCASGRLKARSDVIMSAMASEITGVSIVCLSVCSGADQGKHPRSASLAFVKGNPPVDDVTMRLGQLTVLMNLQTINEWNLKAPHLWSFVREYTGEQWISPYKGPVIWKAFRCHEPSLDGETKYFACSHFLSVGTVLCHYNWYT